MKLIRVNKPFNITGSKQQVFVIKPGEKLLKRAVLNGDKVTAYRIYDLTFTEDGSAVVVLEGLISDIDLNQRIQSGDINYI